MRFIRESDGWKIRDQSFSNVAIDPASLYALVPPPTVRLCSRLTLAERKPRCRNTQYYRPNITLEAAGDVRSAYLIFELKRGALPAPDTEVQGSSRISSGAEWPAIGRL